MIPFLPMPQKKIVCWEKMNWSNVCVCSNWKKLISKENIHTYGKLCALRQKQSQLLENYFKMHKM